MTDDRIAEPTSGAEADESAEQESAAESTVPAEPTEQASAAESTAPTVDAVTTAEPVVDAAEVPVAEDAGVPVQYGIGGFSLREVILSGVWAVAFAASFFSTTGYTFTSVWTRGIDWILAIGVPTVAVFLLLLRRLSPSGIRRVGSLGIDQFASVAFSVAAVVWLAQLWAQIGLAASGGPWVLTWVPWLELVLMLAGVALTVAAPVIPVVGEDFRHRADAPAHRNARPHRPVTVRPLAPRAAVTAPAPAPVQEAPSSGERVEADPVTPAAAAAEGAEPQPVRQAFWALVPEERDVVDEHGDPLFRIGPTAWALVIEDRGASFVVRHDDGRVGELRDVGGVTRG